MDPTTQPDTTLEAGIRDHLGEGRCAELTRAFRGRHTTLEDALALASIAARRRAFNDKQRVIFGAMHVLRRGGMRPNKADDAAWREASGLPPKAPVQSDLKPAAKVAKKSKGTA